MVLVWVAIVAVAQIVSLFPDPSPCLVEIEGYRSGQQQQSNNGCAPLHVMAVWLIEALSRWFGANNSAIIATINAIATGVIALFTVTLWWSTHKLREIGEQQKAIAAQAADIAEKQMLIAGRQTDIQSKQHAIGRLQFIADKRPRLRVRHVILHEDVRDRLGDPDTVVNGRLVVVNAGGTDARIVDSKCRVFWAEFGLPMDLDLEGSESFELAAKDSAPIRGGESCSYPFHAPGPLRGVADDVESGVCRLFVVGFIRYADVEDTERFMGFCREFVVPDGSRGGRFVAVDDPDYEYED